MAHREDVDRFNRWATTYDRHWTQRVLFGPIQRTVLQLAAQQVGRPGAILDVGCGTGKLLRSAGAAFPSATLFGVDAAIEMVKTARASDPTGAIRFQHATAETLPFPDAQFDLVFSTMTFHHWQDKARGIAEVRRVLTQDGRWLLADFVASGWMRYVRRALRMHQFPARADLDPMLRVTGLKVVAERRVPGLGGQVAVLAVSACAVRAGAAPAPR
ncbi:MAG TPA: class I SAM-dependent methyltransferase [Candidatus Dormibacteraeota bacterium]|nr:class I SAM-dependent methyltransferase [Candidatus Dormibacteraeota bacterium]